MLNVNKKNIVICKYVMYNNTRMCRYDNNKANPHKKYNVKSSL